MESINEIAKVKYTRYSVDGVPHVLHGIKDYMDGATVQHEIDIRKLKDVMNRLMIDTKDKAEIIKAMEE